MRENRHVAHSVAAMAALVVTLISNDVYAQAPADRPMFDISTIFEDMDTHTMTAGLRPVDLEDERFRGIMGIVHGYTYFDFTGEIVLNRGRGLLSRVVFANRPNSVGGSGFAIGVDTKVLVEIDGEWQYAWFFSTQLVLKAVVPVVLWGDFFGYRYQDTPALLVIGLTLGTNDAVRIITVRDNTIHVFRPNFEDARPHWYWYDTD